MKAENFTDLVGNTPCVQYKANDLKSNVTLWVKLEGYNPSGSLKDRACLSNINGAIQDGSLRTGKTILDASSGNMACSIAYFGAVFGYPVEVVCNSKLTSDKEDFINYYGAKLIRYGDFTLESNSHCREIMSQESATDYCFLDQLHNWNNPMASYNSMGPEILAEIPNITALFASLGSGGTLYGTAKYIKENKKDVYIVSVEAASGTVIPGTGGFDDGDYITPFIEKGMSENLFDERVRVNYQQAIKRVQDVSKAGFFVGHQTGGVVESAISIIKKYNITGNVVVISGDIGWKNMEHLKNK